MVVTRNTQWTNRVTITLEEYIMIIFQHSSYGYGILYDSTEPIQRKAQSKDGMAGTFQQLFSGLESSGAATWLTFAIMSWFGQVIQNHSWWKSVTWHMKATVAHVIGQRNFNKRGTADWRKAQQSIPMLPIGVSRCGWWESGTPVDDSIAIEIMCQQTSKLSHSLRYYFFVLNGKDYTASAPSVVTQWVFHLVLLSLISQNT